MISQLDLDTELLVYSYLEFDELIKILEDYNLIQKIIRIYKIEVPSIIEASKNGDLETVKYLMSTRYPKSNWKDAINIRQAILYASGNGSLEIVKLLSQNGFRVGEGAICIASENGRLDVSEYLYSLGFIPSQLSIDIALEREHLAIVNFFHEKGIKPSPERIENARYTGYLDGIEYSAKNGFKFNRDSMNWHILMGHLVTVKNLYLLGVKPPIFAMDLAFKSQSEEMINLLYTFGCKPKVSELIT